MASFSIDPELKALLDWNPPKLSLAPEASKSKASRGPSFYDLHLSENLILNEVILRPSLHRDIAQVVENTLSSLRDRGIIHPDTSDRRFATREDRKDDDVEISTRMINERSVANYYSRRAAKYCIPVASTLALHPQAPKWTTILEYDQVPSKSNYAIADGVVRIIPVFKDLLLGIGVPSAEEAMRLDALDGSKKAGLVKLAKKKSGDFFTSEIKSLTVAPEGTMVDVKDLANGTQFPWAKCDEVDCERHKPTFDLHGGAKPSVDATNTPWKLSLEASYVEAGPSTRTLKQSVDPVPSSIQPPEAAPINQKDIEAGPSRTLRKRSSRVVSSILNFTKDRKTTASKGKRKRDDSDVGDYKPRQTPTAEKFLQQAWAQAVRNDTTLMTLHAGSFEYIGVRHRATQRLYISELIDVHNCRDPGYGQLQVGLYIAALEDAMNRALQMGMEDSGKSGGQEPFGSERKRRGDAGDDKGGDQGGGGSGGGDSAIRRRAGGSSKESEKGSREGKERGGNYNCTLLHEAKLRRIAMVYLRYGVYHSPVPACFIRQTAPTPAKKSTRSFPPQSPGTKQKFRPDESMLIILTSEITEGATGIIHDAKLQVQTSDGYLTGDVVIKLALRPDQKARLLNEYSIYQHLASKHVTGIPIVLGLFDYGEEGPSILIMTHGGTCLHSGQAVSSTTRSTLLTTLEDIHKAGVLHGDLRPQNLLIDWLGKASIVDFDLSRKGALDQDKKCEYAELVHILETLDAKEGRKVYIGNL